MRCATAMILSVLTVGVSGYVTNTAEAHLVAKPRTSTLSGLLASQTENFKHARYVCNKGGRANKVWHCKTQIWLKKEKHKTHIKLNPPKPKLKYLAAWTCIHSKEGAWNANTGNGYYGGLQMDYSFMTTYGSDMIRKYGGHAHLWSPYDQMLVAERAVDSGRGFYPWPNTARICGLI